MKLISLNTFGASQGQIFFDFVEQHKADTDIFCFQEVCSTTGDAPKTSDNAHTYGYEELSSILTDFVPFFEPKSSSYVFGEEQAVDWPINLGVAVFVRKDIRLLSYAGRIIGDAVAAGGQPLEGLIKVQVLGLADKNGKRFHILNTHGLSRPGSKLDTPERLKQSQRLLEIIQCLPPEEPAILCGDFNLMPETESVKMLEGQMRNLIKDFRIENTRNEISWNKHGNGRQHFADYTFVSPEMEIRDFEVPYNLVSDHLPMILEFKI